MKPSRETVVAVAAATGFRQDMVEKVMNLLDLLDALAHHPFLSSRLVLKGGTALNVFLDDLPRLSVDIDLNYIGSAALEGMEAERPEVEDGIRLVATRLGYSIRRRPDSFAGGKWVLNYQSSLGGGGNLALASSRACWAPTVPPTSRCSISTNSHRANSSPSSLVERRGTSTTSTGCLGAPISTTRGCESGSWSMAQ
jgi:hypothetical protein